MEDFSIVRAASAAFEWTGMTDGTGPPGGGFPNDAAVELFNRLLDQRRSIMLGLTGARYCGKSHFIDRVEGLLNQEKIPCAKVKVDVTAPLAEQPEDILDRLVVAFTDVHGRTVRFPRYLLARSVLKEEIDPPDGQAVRDRVREVLRDTWRADNLPAVIGDLAGAVSGLYGLPETSIRDGVTRITRGIFGTDAGTAIVRRPRATWFAQDGLLENPKNATAGLAQLWEWRHGGRWDQRDQADYVLAAAFLADVRENAEKGSWHGNHAIVLDNADAPRAAIRLVRALAHVLGEHDRATIAVTHRGGLLAEVGAEVGGDVVVDPVQVPVADPAKRASMPPDGTRWWPLRLPDLGEGGIREMLHEATSWDEPTRGSVAEAVYRLTRGHPGTTVDVVKRLVGLPQPAAARVDLGSIFDADTEDALIRRLTGRLQPAAQTALETCSAVRDHDHVGVLVGDGIGVAAVRHPELWVPGRAGRLVLLPVLRRFLLRRFAERGTDAPDGWNTVFTRLAEHVRDGESEEESEESELYYRLALGETEAVTRHLYTRLSRGDPARWIGLHKNVTLAPGRFGDEPYSAVLARHKAWAMKEDWPLRALADLVVRLWLVADPFSEPPSRDDIRAAIRQDYRDLGFRFPAADPLLSLEAAKWS